MEFSLINMMTPIIDFSFHVKEDQDHILIDITDYHSDGITEATTFISPPDIIHTAQDIESRLVFTILDTEST